MNIISGIYWDKGEREENQDSLMLEQVFSKRGRILLSMVGDGIGSLSEGETASGFLAEKLLIHFYREIVSLVVKGKTDRTVERSFRRCLYELNQQLICYGRSKEIRLGTTVSMIFIRKNRYLLLQLGDSRIYRISGKDRIVRAEKLTRDHLDENGRLKRCLGSFAYKSPDVKKGKIRKNTGFLLCTDGFFENLDKRTLAQVLNPRELTDEKAIEKRLKELAGEACRRGGTDNLSAVYLICR